MEIALGLVALVAVVCLVSAVAERFRLSAPLLLVGVGFIGSYLPFIPDEQQRSGQPESLGDGADQTHHRDERDESQRDLHTQSLPVVAGNPDAGFATGRTGQATPGRSMAGPGSPDVR